MSASNAAAAAPRPALFPALRSRPFALFWSGLVISHTGTWMQSVGQGWLVYQLTNTPVWLGITSLAFAVPMVVLPLIGGAIADRFHRIALIRAIQLFMAVVSGLTAVLTYTGTIQAWHLAAFSLIQGIVLAFEGPARHATVPELVDRDRLLSALSLVSSSYQLGGFFGPGLAGVLLGVLGNDRIYVLFALNGLSFLIYAVNLSLIRGTSHARDASASLLGSLADGARFVWRQPTLRTLLGLTAIAGMFGRSYVALMPVFARDVLHTDARGLGFLTAAPGIGVILGATVLSTTGASGRKGRMIVASSLTFATMLGAFTLSRLMPLSLTLLVILGIATITQNAAINTTMQLAAPGPLRGRVMSLSAIANVGLPSVGAMLTASAAAVVGAPLAVGVGACVVAAAAVALGRQVLRVD